MRKSITLRLKIEHLAKEEVRRGWVRIHEADRQGLLARKIVKVRVKNMAPSVRRILLGFPDHGAGCMELDEATREDLGIKEDDLNQEKELQLAYTWPLVGDVAYYWCHPDPTLAFATRVAIVLGGLSVLLSLLSLLVSLCRS